MARVNCEYDKCKCEATHRLTLTIADAEARDSFHDYCPFHIEVAEINILAAASGANRAHLVTTTKRPLWEDTGGEG